MQKIARKQTNHDDTKSSVIKNGKTSLGMMI